MVGPEKAFDKKEIEDFMSRIRNIDVASASLINLNLTNYTYSFEDMYDHYYVNGQAAKLLTAVNSWNYKNPNKPLDFPEYTELGFEDLFLNEIEQRELNIPWAAKIASHSNFDARQVAIVYCAYSPKEKRYYVFEGQHTTFALKMLVGAGILPKNYKVKVVYITTDDPEVRRELTESINGDGRVAWSNYDHWRNSIYAVHYDKSTNPKHTTRYEKYLTVLKHNCYILDKTLHEGKIKENGSKQGLITHIDVLDKISNKTLDKALAWHNKFFKDQAVHSITLFAFMWWEKEQEDGRIDFDDAAYDDLGAMLANNFGTIQKYADSLSGIIKEHCKQCKEKDRNARKEDKYQIPLVMYNAYGGKRFVHSNIINAYSGTNGGGSLTDSMGIKSLTEDLVIS